MEITALRFFDSIKSLSEELNNRIRLNSAVFLLTDSNVAELCIPRLFEEMPEANTIEIIEIEPGESSKCIAIWEHIVSLLAERGATRNTLLICLGGGVVTDLGGFVASTYKRGISFLNIPTSLIGMADAAIGGKTGIDHDSIKNVLGTFAQPEEVWIAYDFLETLPENEKRSGFAEMLKHGLVADAAHWNALLAATSDTDLHNLIIQSAHIKWRIAYDDPYEKGMRKLLNFGHTIGHAIESHALSISRPLLHGHCVAAGMMAESAFSVGRTGLSQLDCEAIVHELNRLYPEIQTFFPEYSDLAPFLFHDKKRIRRDTLNFTLLEAPGKAIINCEISPSEVESSWNEFLQRVSTM